MSRSSPPPTLLASHLGGSHLSALPPGERSPEGGRAAAPAARRGPPFPRAPLTPAPAVAAPFPRPREPALVAAHGHPPLPPRACPDLAAHRPPCPGVPTPSAPRAPSLGPRRQVSCRQPLPPARRVPAAGCRHPRPSTPPGSAGRRRPRSNRGHRPPTCRRVPAAAAGPRAGEAGGGRRSAPACRGQERAGGLTGTGTHRDTRPVAPPPPFMGSAAAPQRPLGAAGGAQGKMAAGELWGAPRRRSWGCPPAAGGTEGGSGCFPPPAGRCGLRLPSQLPSGTPHRPLRAAISQRFLGGCWFGGLLLDFRCGFVFWLGLLFFSPHFLTAPYTAETNSDGKFLKFRNSPGCLGADRAGPRGAPRRDRPGCRHEA